MKEYKLRILTVTSLFPNKLMPQYGTFVKEQIDALRQNYHNEIKIDVYFINGAKTKFNYIKALFFLPWLIYKKNYNIVHVHYGLTLISTLFIFVPIVVTYHGSDLALRPLKILSKILRFKIDSAIVVSESLKKDMPKSTIIPCGINVEKFKVPKNQLERRIKKIKKPSKLKVLFPGSPSLKVKNYKLFNEACERLCKKGIKVTKLHLCNIRRENVPNLFWDCDLMLLTSFREGSPTVIKEAIASKLPFVTVDVGDVKKWVKKINFGAVCSKYDPDDIADSVISLFKFLQKENKIENKNALYEISNVAISKQLKIHYEMTLKRIQRKRRLIRAY